ncbi:cell envelope biogenesis protein LolA [Rufibacter radiotolerans]|uniref:Cell envelope biogenesis protein LolA n=1 Tax=Rufibacter radiotolerans TaxID=1379910 RepID=A0A0H4W7E5_9BACT|nr:outer membrane lipoprotein carrier protein LolA [Rufibacter radiotolerans]AKQ46356.1 cell envelope biogenesis protein LolA [Rufibacter radiotolerans]
MKRIFSLLLAFLLVVPFAQAQNAQKDPQAQKILDAMSKKYQAMNAFKVSFTQTLESPSTKVKESINGDITVAGNKFRLAVAGQEIINNGATIWTFMKKENEVTISDFDPEEQEMTPNQIYTLYQKGYRYVYAGEEKVGGEAVHVVDLTPDDRDNQVFKVRLHISKKDNSIKSWKMFRKNGNRYTYSVKKFTANPPLENNYFAFDKSKYKGVKVVDLR